MGKSSSDSQQDTFRRCVQVKYDSYFKLRNLEAVYLFTFYAMIFILSIIFPPRCSALEGCKYSTPKMSLLKAHERAHRGERNFQCGQCSCAFIEKSHLTRHQKSVHSTEDEKPFACTETKSGCTFKTKRRDKLKDHLARIHGITQVPDNKGLKPSVLKTPKSSKKGGKKKAAITSCDKT